ncbi:protein of unknown function [Zobellia uliginosa]|uniref:DUF4301 domain-containing protein n=1 Tax=Zobellia uliginosa TaxID=143224 RepID=A0ABY1KJ83_9FLAO|nr:DUF4301 family protein [Zobellia uliginosa]SIS40737.1 protein of unknown function [Zobellia uliginosa]
MTLTENDLALLAKKGISEKKVNEQIETFKEGIPFVQLEKAVTVGEGLSKFTPSEEKELIQKFEASRTGLSLLKFVPASGAASRMFKALFNFLDAYDPKEESLEAYFERTDDKAMKTFSEGVADFAFYDLVKQRIAGKTSSKDEELYLFVKEMMSEDGLNYGFYPKGLLPFHNYGDHTATPFEEHLKEASVYAKTGNTAELHFTISEQHGDMFNAEFNAVSERVSKATETSFKVSYSYQKPSTDTIAVDMQNEPFRNSDGSVLFRPGGHGALIENLNEQDADIIFIKNIDNVTVPRFAGEVADSKKILAGVLLSAQEKAFAYAKSLDNDELTSSQLDEIKSFLENELNVRFSDNFAGFSIGEQIEVLKDKIDRPIRICGMVKNEGEPGGGPFWINDRKGNISLQIIESAQIDMDNAHQAAILKNSTHFNPVDLVCAVKNYKGEKYNLMNYIDTKQGFITGKTKEGRELKALELPGLWNGAMAFWNTIFVEVPSSTFNPVKTVNDLLRPAHQVK